MTIDDIGLGAKNFIKHDWIEDNSVLCATCKYATWGWRNLPWCKQRFVNGCVRSPEKRGNSVSIISMVSNFNPYIVCPVYEKLEVKE